MNIHDFLKERGYQGPVKERFKDYTVYFHRKVPGTTHQFVVYEYNLYHNGKEHYSYEVTMTYETFDGIWVNSRFYGLTEDVLQNKLDKLEQRLYDSVTPMGGDKKVYDGGWD